jgi:hypothetical protein
MREAILAELGLMPLWLPRAEQSQATGNYLAVVLQRNDGKLGWCVTATPFTGDAEILFANVCEGLELQRLTEPQAVDNSFMHLPEEVEWLWLSGLQRDKCDIVADMPVFESVGIFELASHAALKAKLWADWCRWRFL